MIEELPVRIANKIRCKDSCWTWQGFVHPSGYGRVRWNGKQCQAHRVVYELLAGPIPAGHHLDHLCRNRACVRPSHLEPVTCRENILRGEGLAATNVVKVTCPQGHPFDRKYTRSSGHVMRICRTCHNEVTARARQRVRRLA